MKKTNGFSLSILFLLLSANVLLAQPGRTISNSFHQYQQATLQEKIFTHTDKDTYLAGEIIWFKIYNLDAATHLFADVSKVAYVEMLDAANKAVLQSKVSLKAGRGAGSLYLPSALPSGSYTFRVYTHWMKNFTADYFFHKTIRVLNTLQEEKAPAPVAATNAIQFFPEGGRLVSGLPSKLAFRAVDGTGKGLKFRGAIVNQDNDTVARFEPGRFGIGAHSFLPEKGATYRAFIRPEQGKPFTAPVPEMLDEGYVLSVTQEGTGLRAVVRTNIPGRDSLYLFIHGGRKSLSQSAAVVEGQAAFFIGADNLPEGISHITLFDRKCQPLCERLYFRKPVKGISLTATTNQHQYLNRQKVKLEIAGFDENRRPVSADFSVSVFKTDSLAHAEEDIRSYLWLSSELKGKIENPSYYLTSGDEQAADLLMLTHGWRRFKWRALLENKPATHAHLPEVEGHVVSARLLDPVTLAPTARRTAYLSVPGRRVQFYSAESDTSGLLKFYTRDFYGPSEVILQTDQRWDSLKVEVLSPFSTERSSFASRPFVQQTGSTADLLQSSIAMQLRNIYAGKFLNRELLPPVDSSNFFLKADKTYLLDDYVRFSTMEEVLREYVPEISLAIRRKSYQLKMLDYEIKQFLPTPPLILLDGVPVFDDGNKIIAFDPLKVQKLEVVNTPYIYGSAVFDGIASFTTYKGDLGGFEVHPKATVVDYEGMQLQREFYAPMYEGDINLSRIPDYRNTLYWSPLNRTDGEGKASFDFYTSDMSGNYTIVVQGIAEGGRPGMTITSFDVNSK